MSQQSFQEARKHAGSGGGRGPGSKPQPELSIRHGTTVLIQGTRMLRGTYAQEALAREQQHTLGGAARGAQSKSQPKKRSNPSGPTSTTASGPASSDKVTRSSVSGPRDRPKQRRSRGRPGPTRPPYGSKEPGSGDGDGGDSAGETRRRRPLPNVPKPETPVTADDLKAFKRLSRPDADAQKAQLTELRAAMAKFRQQLETLSEERTKLQQELAKVPSFASSQEQLDRARAKFAKAKKEFKAAASRVEALVPPSKPDPKPKVRKRHQDGKAPPTNPIEISRKIAEIEAWLEIHGHTQEDTVAAEREIRRLYDLQQSALQTAAETGERAGPGGDSGYREPGAGSPASGASWAEQVAAFREAKADRVAKRQALDAARAEMNALWEAAHDRRAKHQEHRSPLLDRLRTINTRADQCRRELATTHKALAQAKTAHDAAWDQFRANEQAFRVLEAQFQLSERDRREAKRQALKDSWETEAAAADKLARALRAILRKQGRLHDPAGSGVSGGGASDPGGDVVAGGAAAAGDPSQFTAFEDVSLLSPSSAGSARPPRGRRVVPGPAGDMPTGVPQARPAARVAQVQDITLLGRGVGSSSESSLGDSGSGPAPARKKGRKRGGRKRRKKPGRDQGQGPASTGPGKHGSSMTPAAATAATVGAGGGGLPGPIPIELEHQVVEAPLQAKPPSKPAEPDQAFADWQLELFDILEIVPPQRSADLIKTLQQVETQLAWYRQAKPKSVLKAQSYAKAAAAAPDAPPRQLRANPAKPASKPGSSPSSEATGHPKSPTAETSPLSAPGTAPSQTCEPGSPVKLLEGATRPAGPGKAATRKAEPEAPVRPPKSSPAPSPSPFVG